MRRGCKGSIGLQSGMHTYWRLYCKVGQNQGLNLYTRTPPAPCHRRGASRGPRGAISGFRPGPEAALAGSDKEGSEGIRRAS